MKTSLIVILIGLTLMIQSCDTVYIKSNKQSAYNKHPKRFYIIFHYTNSETKSQSNFCKQLSVTLQKKLIDRGINSDVFLKDQLSLVTNEDIEKKIRDYNPDVILRIEETFEDPSLKTTYELTMVDVMNKQNVWKGDMDLIQGQYDHLSELVPKASQAIINKLIADKVI